MSEKSSRVLIVDDSATMRHVIREILSGDPLLEVVGEACDPHQAREAIKALDPDVITLDVEMPNMNGLDFLERLMRLRPMPVVMVSSLTSHGAEATIQALELGAFDCVSKPKLNDPNTINDLRRMVRAAASTRGKSRAPAQAAPVRRAVAPSSAPDDRIVAIGSSTGGVEALITVLSGFPENCPPTVVTQHMPAMFTKPFAARLDRLCPPRVSEAWDGAPLEPGTIYVAPGGKTHLMVRGKPGSYRCQLVDTDLVNGHRPSVDVLFHSVAKSAGGRSAGIILTGMGRDGAMGLAAMRTAGALTFGQTEDTCIVYGMPKAAFEIGAVSKQVSLQNMATELFAALRDTR